MARFEWFDDYGTSYPSLVCVAEDDQDAMLPVKELPILRVKQLFDPSEFQDFRNAPRIPGYRPQGTQRFIPYPDEPDPWYAIVILYVPDPERTRMMNINYEKIGTGLYDLLDESDKAVVAFGMIPLHTIELVTKMMKEKVVHLTCEELGEPGPSQEIVDRLTGAIRPSFVAEFQRKVTVAIFAAAKDADMMVA